MQATSDETRTDTDRGRSIPADHERLERERSYHNSFFSGELREAQGKYYYALEDGKLLFLQMIRESAENADVLEFGCGKGDISLSLAPLCRSITGIDISDVAIAMGNAEAEEMEIANSNFLTMNAEEMTFPDNSFDLIFGSSIIHHLDIAKSYAEIARTLRPGGSAVFWEPLGHNALINLYRRLTPVARTPDEHPLVWSDVTLAQRYFSKVDCKFFGLTTLVAVPFRETPLFRPVYALTQSLDRLIFSIPGLQWQAWFVCMQLWK